MLKVRLSRQFRKDLEKARKRGLKMKKLDKVVLMLAEEQNSRQNTATMLW